MGFLSSLFKAKKIAAPFEAFIGAFSDDPNLADRVIRDAKQPNRLMMAICLACLQGGYRITVEIRKTLSSTPTLPEDFSPDPLPFDDVLQEVIAFVFYTVMDEHMREADEADEADEQEDESEVFKVLKEARFLADSLASKYIVPRNPVYFHNRLLVYSLASYKRKNLFEEAARHILKAMQIDSANATIGNIMLLQLVQYELIQDLPTLKESIYRLYEDWKSNPKDFFFSPS